MKSLLFVLCLATAAVGPAAAPGQAAPNSYPYLLRVSHETSGSYSCALLQNSGGFHLEFARGDKIIVFEGIIDSSELAKVLQILSAPGLTTLSQRQIEEPLLRSRKEKLQLTIYRNDHQQDLFFQSAESEEPFKDTVRPLVRWLDGLHALPHTEFSEEEGKQNCLPQRKIALKRRPPGPRLALEFTPPVSGPGAGLGPLTLQQSVALPRFLPLLRASSFAMNGGNARQFCVLVAENGQYRFEDRAQKSGKPVKTRVLTGTLELAELARLREILDDPAMANIHHHEPGRDPVRVMGDMLDLVISRSEGEQRITLTSGFGHEFGTFYGGDGHIGIAQGLTKFLHEHMEKPAAATLDKPARNGCTSLP